MAATSVDEALVTHALKQSALTNLIQKRLYHIKAPIDAKRPYVVLNQIAPSADSEEFTKGRMGQPLFQWSCISYGDEEKTPSDAFLISHVLLDIFANYQGTMEGVVIKVIWARGPRTGIVTRGDDILCVVETEVHYEEP